MSRSSISKLLTLITIAVFSSAFIDSTASADNASGIKNLEYHLLDTGHFALETHGQEIADLMHDFLNRQLQPPGGQLRPHLVRPQ